MISAAAAPHHLSSRSLHQFFLRSSVLRFIRRESDTLIFIRTNDILVVSPKTAYQKSSPALRPTKSGPDFCRFLLDLLSLSHSLSPPLLSSPLYFYFLHIFCETREKERTIDRLSAFCDIAIRACCERERERLESDGDDYKVARIEGGQKQKQGISVSPAEFI